MRLSTALLGSDRTAPVHAVANAFRDGAGVHGVLDAVVDAVSERMLRYDLAGDFDVADDFGWLDITHGVTYAHAVAMAPRCGPRLSRCNRRRLARR